MVVSKSENVGQEKQAMDILGRKLHDNKVIKEVSDQIGLLRSVSPTKNHMKIESLKKIIDKLKAKSPKV